MVTGVSHERHAHALDLWRSGDKLARRHRAPDWTADDEAAIAAAVAILRRHRAMEDLVAAFFNDRHDDELDALCQRPGGGVLNFGIVEDAAYWRRRRELLGERQIGT